MRRLAVAGGLLAVLTASVSTVEERRVRPAHFHHVHVNATSPARTQEFYEKTFGAQPVRFKDTTDALFTSRGFILINKVERTPRDIETTAIRHIGWAGVDGPGEFAGFEARGAQFHTPLTPLGRNWFFYIFGPDREIAEVYTGDQNHLFNHVHFSVDDVAATARWYERTLGMTFPSTAVGPRPADPNARWGSSARLDGVSFVLIYKDHYYAESEHRLPVGRQLQTTRGSAIDHIAFSYERIAPEFERMKSAGVPIVEPIADRPDGVRSFFITGPDAVLIEIVQAKPIPDGLWR
ncbi:MAG TPA: VOC family protein [Vicinamibacterales bacterium]|nr:VOC family protein [Vicinamibacterales bacterium]